MDGSGQGSRLSCATSFGSTCASSRGRQPVKLFPPSSSISSCARFPNSGGIGPVSRLFWRVSRSNCARLPNSGGIAPVSWLLKSHRYSSRARLPSAAGIDPVSPRHPRRNSVTRGCGLPRTVTPSQAVIARYALQSSAAVPRSASFAASRAVQSATKPGLFAASGTASPIAQGPGDCGGATAGAAQIDHPTVISKQTGAGSAVCAAAGAARASSTTAVATPISARRDMATTAKRLRLGMSSLVTTDCTDCSRARPT